MSRNNVSTLIDVSGEEATPDEEDHIKDCGSPTDEWGCAGGSRVVIIQQKCSTDYQEAKCPFPFDPFPGLDHDYKALHWTEAVGVRR